MVGVNISIRAYLNDYFSVLTPSMEFAANEADGLCIAAAAIQDARERSRRKRNVP
jgi:hypothetical protein